MKHLIKSLKYSVAVLGALAMLSHSLKAATSDNLGLSGQVASILSISVSANASASGLGLTAATAGTDIGNVTETCNDADGYTVTVTSTNGASGSASTGILTGASHSEDLTYTLTYNSNPVTLVNGAATVTDVNEKTAAGGVTKTVQILYDPSSNNLAADTYSDTLTFSIAAK